MSQGTLTLRSADIPRTIKFGLGFDHLLDELSRLSAPQDNYPPFNIIRDSEDRWRVELAVAGFEPSEVSVTTERRKLIVAGERLNIEEPEYVHRGISGKRFQKTWPLGENVEVLSATFKNGILSIVLERIIPEAEKTKTIDITYEG